MTPLLLFKLLVALDIDLDEPDVLRVVDGLAALLTVAPTFDYVFTVPVALGTPDETPLVFLRGRAGSPVGTFR